MCNQDRGALEQYEAGVRGLRNEAQTGQMVKERACK